MMTSVKETISIQAINNESDRRQAAFMDNSGSDDSLAVAAVFSGGW
jgi:hypothetical protein